jgi:hypothetical protein
MAGIPKTIHYCFGMAEDFGGKPWSLLHHVCVRSAIAHIKPDKVLFYYHHEPSGPWWEATRTYVTPVWIELPTEIFGNPVDHPAHRADIVRLDRLLAEGGIYLDADVLVRRSFDSLLDAQAVLGVEGAGGWMGLANAVILAQPGASFIARWRDEYHWFRGNGDEHWNEHSVMVPARLAAEHPDEISIAPFTAFYWPLWTDEHIDWIFNSDDPVGNDDAYAHHLWESRAWGHVRGLTPGQVRARDTNFNRWARPYLKDLPDDYGSDGGETPLPPEPAPAWDEAAPAHASRHEVFDQIYADTQWGNDGEAGFFSGVGSRGPVVDQYIAAMAPQLAALHAQLGRDITVVDIGCGDFVVGSRLVEACPFIHYIGCDIVGRLIAHHREHYTTDRARFELLDIVTHTPPHGDVCLVRQVFQHLPNRDVRDALARLHGFAALFVSEGQPAVRHGPFNPDKPLGSGVRYDWRRGIGRGLELSKPPFSLRTQEIVRCFSPPYEEIVTERVWFVQPSSSGESRRSSGK